jgi:outer membrane protein OmpA-like peptidoglycan-associated protein
MRNRILKSAWTLAVCLPTLAMAQQRRAPPPEAMEANRAGSWEFSLGAGVLYVDGALRGFLAQSLLAPAFANTANPSALAPTAVARVGYNFNRHLGFSLAGAAASGSGVTYLTPEASVTYTVNLNARTSPFFLVGTELTRFNGQSDRVTHTTWGLHAGLGVRHMIGENLALRLEGQMRFEGIKETLLRETAYNSAITLGISYFVAGRRPREAPRAAEGCRPCTLARVDTIVRMRRDTVVRVRMDTVRVTRVDTVSVEAPTPDQLVLRVQFQTDRTELLPKSRPVLDTIAYAIIATPGSHWAVQGHTDNVGTREHNLGLSQGRAQSVLDYLVRRGVDRSILTAVGFGYDRPVFSNSTVYGRAQNRRVQLRRVPAPPTGPPVK